MLGKKHLWIIIACLMVLNTLTLVLWLINSGKESVAVVGNEKISRQQWIEKMETKYGQDTLKELVDQLVMEEMAKKYKINISEKEIEREWLLIKTVYGANETLNTSEKDWKKQIKSTLILEELLTKDARISKDELKKYYEQNREIYNIPTAYHVSQIVLKTKEDADQTMKELENGSNFKVLALEKSIDEISSSNGGDLGFILENNQKYSENFMDIVKNLKQESWSNPIKTEEGYIILFLHKKIKGKNYSFKEVKNQIRRQIALEQMDSTVSVSAFWNEVGVNWLYDN